MKHKSWAEITQILERQKQSGLSLQKFAVREGLAFSTLQRWARKACLAAVNQDRTRLVELPNPFATAAGGGSYRLHFPAGCVVEVAPGFRVEELRALAQVLHSL